MGYLWLLLFLAGLLVLQRTRWWENWINRQIRAEQVKRLDYLHPRQNAREMARQQKKKQWSYCLTLAFAGVFLLMLLELTGTKPEGSLTDLLTRADFQETDKRVKVIVAEEHGNDGPSEYPLILHITPKGPDEDQRRELFQHAAEELQTILRDQTEFDRVDRDLELVSELSGDVTVEWRSSDYSVLGSFGKIGEEIPPEGQRVVLTAILKYAEWREDFSFDLMVYPKRDDRSVRERLLEHVAKQLTDPEADQVSLPEQIGDTRLSYRVAATGQEDATWLTILLFGMILLMYLNLDGKPQKELEKRRESLEYDYPELVSKLTLLLSAGLTVPTAWARMVEDYENGSKKERYGYEEMRRALLQLKSGVYEKDVYGEFGRRCELHNYLKLGTLLEENCRSGVKDLMGLLHEEMRLTLDNRINLAKRKGEVARTRLLFPMLLLLVIVMIIVLVPAWMLSGM